jgi:autotransporter-associated beta strand protein
MFWPMPAQVKPTTYMKSKATLYSRQVSRLSIIGLLLGLAGWAEAAVRVWDGGGSNNQWLTAANWEGDVAPAAGDSLIFPARAAQASSVNNFPAYTVFDSLLISNDYHLSGNALALSSGIRVFGTADLDMPIRLTAPQTFRVSTEGDWSTSRLKFFAEIDTQGHELTFDPSSTSDGIEIGEFSVPGGITGAGGIKKIGRGNLWLSGENTYSGITHIMQGTVLIRSGTSLGSSEAGTIVESEAELLLLNEYGGSVVNEPLTLSGKLAGSDIVWAGAIHLPAGMAQIGSTQGVFRITGEISGPGGILVSFDRPFYCERGTLPNTYQGLTDVHGFAAINAIQPQSDVVFAGYYLGGTGSVGRVTATGLRHKTLAPGHGVGRMSTRGLGLDNQTTVEFNLDRAASNSIHVAGHVDLANAQLRTRWGFSSPNLSQYYTLISNDGSDPVIGTFANFPEGALVTNALLPGSSAIFLYITYRGGTDSNDVVLFAGMPPNPTWDGGGSDDFWTTAANWIGEVTPRAGEALVFPDRQSSITNITINDFPAGTTFRSLSIHDPMELQGALLALDAGISAYDNAIITLPVRLNAPQTIFVEHSRSLEINGGIDNGGHDLTLGSGLYGGGSIHVRSTISGAGGLIKLQPNHVYLYQANTYSGRTEVQSGSLMIYHSEALGGTEHGTIVGNGELWLSDGLIVAEPLTLEGALRAQGSAIWNGPMEIGRYCYIYTSANKALQINGAMSGGTLTLVGGTTILSATNTHAGTYIYGGTLFVNGYQPSNTTILLSTSTLGGVGTVGRIVKSGSYYPTPGTGTIAPGTNSVGVLTSGDVSIGTQQRLSLEINGTTSGSYDQLVVNGTVDLDNPTLAVTLGFVPVPGDAFVVIANDGNDAVTGTFFFLPEGAAIRVAGHDLRISYVGGDGNDVVLTAAPALATIRVWDGGGTDGFWTTPANWADDVAPQPGDLLGFPANAARKVNTNNFPASTRFRGLTFGGSGYEIRGQALQLEGGINSANFSVLIALPLQILADQTFTGNLIIDGSVDLGTNTLTLHNVTVNGIVSGTRGIVTTGSPRLLGTNTYSGTTTVLDGELFIGNAKALGAVDQPTVVRPWTVLEVAGGLTVAEPLITAGYLRNYGTWSGPIETVSDNVTLGGIIEGTVFGTGSVRVSMHARFVANNTYTGRTFIDGGTLVIDGDQPQSDCLNLNISSSSWYYGNKLLGTGRMGNLTAMGGTISPGSDAASDTNYISSFSTANLDLRKAVIFLIEYEQTATGVIYDQVRVSGSVVLEEPTLDFITSNPDMPAVGQSFTIIDNDGTDPVQGTFAGWPQGAYNILTNGIFQIDYNGGDGNDVVISRVDIVDMPPPTILALDTNSLGAKRLTVRGQPDVSYALEGTTDLNPAVQWLQLSTGQAGPDGIFSLYDYPPLTNSMRFYRVRSF